MNCKEIEANTWKRFLQNWDQWQPVVNTVTKAHAL